MKNVELIKRNENDEKKLHNYENIINSEENKSDDFSNIIVASPRKRRQKTCENSKVKEKLWLTKESECINGDHIYEEIIPCSSEKEEGLIDENNKAEFPSEHIYDELEQETGRHNQFLQRMRSSLFRLWAAFTPWAVARRVFWKEAQGRDEKRRERVSELSRPNSRIRLNQNKRITKINL